MAGKQGIRDQVATALGMHITAAESWDSFVNRLERQGRFTAKEVHKIIPVILEAVEDLEKRYTSAAKRDVDLLEELVKARELLNTRIKILSDRLGDFERRFTELNEKVQKKGEGNGTTKPATRSKKQSS